MKTYFPDDPVKQKMLEALITCTKLLFSVGTFQKERAQKNAYNIIEKATNEKIEEVLK